MYRFVPREIQALKNQAKRLKRQSRCSQSHALDKIAKQNGYNNWSLLQKHAVKKDSRKDPARVFKVSAPQIGMRVIHVAAIRYDPDLYFYRKDPGQLIFRCPECGEVHYHGAGDWYLGAGDGDRVPHCATPDTNYHFNLVEVLEPAFAGFLPKRILKHFAPPVADDHIKKWFTSHHTPFVDHALLNGKDEFRYALLEGAYNIHAVLCETFPVLVDENTLFKIAQQLDKKSPWIANSAIRLFQKEAMTEV